MTEAATAALRFAFETLGLHKVTIGCVEGNDGSQRVIEKLGFRFLAIARGGRLARTAAGGRTAATS